MKRLITRFSRMSRSEFISLSAILISVNLNWVFIMVFKGIFADFGVTKLTPFSANESLWIFLFLNIIASISSFFIPKKIRNIGSAIIISSIPSGIILYPVAIKTNISLIYAEIFLSILAIIGCFIYELKKSRANKKTIQTGRLLHRVAVIFAIILTINSNYACLLNKGYITSELYQPTVLRDDGGRDDEDLKNNFIEL